MFEKQALSPSDITNAVQTMRNANRVGTDAIQASQGRLDNFFKNVAMTAQNSARTSGNLDASLDSISRAAAEVQGMGSQGQRVLREINPKRVARNVTLGGLGLVATGLAVKHLRNNPTKKEGDNKMYRTKVAANRKELLNQVLNFGSQLAQPLAFSAASAIGTAGINHMIKRRSKNPDKLWNNFTTRFPEFANDKDARESFDVMVDFNPSAAKHPIVVKNFLESTTYGGNDVNINVLGNLANIEAQRSRAELDRSKGIGDAVSRPLGDISAAFQAASKQHVKEEVNAARMEERSNAAMGRNSLSNLERDGLRQRILKDVVSMHREAGIPITADDMQAEYDRLRNLSSDKMDDYGRELVSVQLSNEMRKRGML